MRRGAHKRSGLDVRLDDERGARSAFTTSRAYTERPLLPPSNGMQETSSRMTGNLAKTAAPGKGNGSRLGRAALAPRAEAGVVRPRNAVANGGR